MTSISKPFQVSVTVQVDKSRQLVLTVLVGQDWPYIRMTADKYAHEQAGWIIARLERELAAMIIEHLPPRDAP